MIEIEHKNRLIEELKFKIDNSEEEYQQKINEFKINHEDNVLYAKESQNQIEQLIFERNDLLNKYNELKMNYDKFNIGLQEANNLFNDKTQSFNKVLNAYHGKLREYKSKIQLLKTKIKELTDENVNLQKKIDKINEKKERNIQNRIRNNSNEVSFSHLNNSNIINPNNSFSNNYNSNYQTLMRTSYSQKNNIKSNYYQSAPNRINLSSYYSNSPLTLKNNEQMNYQINNYNYDNYNTYNNLRNPIYHQYNFTEINDPYSASQHKSLDLFRNILSKVDESLRNNKEYISLNQD